MSRRNGLRTWQSQEHVPARGPRRSPGASGDGLAYDPAGCRRFTSGARLGPYEIKSALGAAGMGEVYCARDTKLNRDVAIKVLPDLFAADPDRLPRFGREARRLASLNHPHIAQIYGFEESPAADSGRPAVHALVMELVDGPTLADRINQGPVPLEATCRQRRLRVTR